MDFTRMSLTPDNAGIYKLKSNYYNTFYIKKANRNCKIKYKVHKCLAKYI